MDRYDPPAFSLRLAHKDVSLAVQMGRDLGVPMRLCNLTLEEMNEAPIRLRAAGVAFHTNARADRLDGDTLHVCENGTPGRLDGITHVVAAIGALPNRDALAAVEATGLPHTLVGDAKRRPGQISAGSSGLGTISHLSLSKMMRSAGIEITHVPYRGLSPSLNDLLAGQVDIIFDGIPAIIPHVREGRVRALAVGSQRRVTYVPGLENTPGMAELLPGSGMDMEFWYCISAAAGTPAPAAMALHRATVGAVRREDYREKLLPLGFTPVWDDSPEALADFIRSQDPVWRELVELSGARLD